VEPLEHPYSSQKKKKKKKKEKKTGLVVQSPSLLEEVLQFFSKSAIDKLPRLPATQTPLKKASASSLQSTPNGEAMLHCPLLAATYFAASRPVSMSILYFLPSCLLLLLLLPPEFSNTELRAGELPTFVPQSSKFDSAKDPKQKKEWKMGEIFCTPN
jgi:hypothetical protein